MRIFILEDNKYRMVKFRRELVGHQVDHAETVEDGMVLVKANRYDLIFLDHDLGGEEMVDSYGENTGYQLATFISSVFVNGKDFTQNRKTPCVIHSCNPAGANNIQRALPHAIAIPFTCLDIASVATEWIKHADRHG